MIWVWILLALTVLSAAAVFAVSWVLVSQVIDPVHSSLEEVEQLEVERGNFAAGEMSKMVPDEEGSLIARDSVRLDYCWYRASVPTSKVCVLAHGFWVRRESELKYARIYMQRGYDVLLYHQRASGTSEGKYCTMGYKERYDLADFVEFARKDKGYPEKPCTVGIHGDSMGGTTVILCLLGQNPPDFAVADCPFADLREQLMFSINAMKGLPSRPFEWPADKLLQLRAKFGYKDVSPLNELKAHNGAPDLPLLLIHGTRDRLIPYESTLKLYDAKRGKKALYICPDAGHVRSISQDKEKYYSVVNAFLDKYGF